MIYADFDYYVNTFLGNVITDETEFSRLAVRAGIELEHYTFGRTKEYADDDAVRMASCAVAEKLFYASRAEMRSAKKNGEVQAETVGGFHRTYRSGADTASQARAEIYSVVVQYLANTGLLYRGVY